MKLKIEDATPRADPEGNVIDYTYNAANRIDLIKKNTVTEADYDYDAAGRLIKRTLGNGSYAEYSYDNASQLTLLANKRSNGQVLSSFAYQPDNAAYITQIEMTQENADQTTTHNFVHYTYDQLYRLTGEVRKDETDTNTIYTQTFTYDANGNRLQVVKTGTIGNETINYTYNAADQMVQEAVVGGATATYSFDANGNMIQKDDGANTYTYGYDYENRLISFDAPGTMNDASYVYSIDSWERISKSVNGTTTKYLRDGPNVIAEYDGANTLIATYLEGLGTDEHISKTIGTNTYRYFTDHLLSVRQLADSSEAIQNSYDYSSFGQVLGTPTQNVLNDYRFTGRRRDSETSSQYHRWRVYYPDIGTWGAKDPEGGFDGGNLYVYVEANPSRYGDPVGLDRIILPAPGNPQLPSPDAGGQGNKGGKCNICVFVDRDETLGTGDPPGKGKPAMCAKELVAQLLDIKKNCNKPICTELLSARPVKGYFPGGNPVIGGGKYETPGQVADIPGIGDIFDFPGDIHQPINPVNGAKWKGNFCKDRISKGNCGDGAFLIDDKKKYRDGWTNIGGGTAIGTPKPPGLFEPPLSSAQCNAWWKKKLEPIRKACGMGSGGSSGGKR